MATFIAVQEQSNGGDDEDRDDASKRKSITRSQCLIATVVIFYAVLLLTVDIATLVAEQRDTPNKTDKSSPPLPDGVSMPVATRLLQYVLQLSGKKYSGADNVKPKQASSTEEEAEES